MKRFVLIPLALALVAALAPAASLAKGASQAEIVGPGLDEPITLKNQGLRSNLGKLAEVTGFYPAVFTQIPDPMLSQRPGGDLGPKYRVTYVMPGPDNSVDRLHQDLYPYASPGPVSYVEPDQTFFGTERTRGGWFVAAPALLTELVAAGLPRTAPSTGDGGGLPLILVVLGSALAAALALVVLARIRIRSRSGPATA